MKIQLRQLSGSASEATIGRHRVTVDRPVAKGGSDAGPMGGELFLASVGGCFMSNLLAAIAARQSPVSNICLEVEGELAGSPARFIGLVLSVTAESAEPELVARLIDIADRGCIMMNTLRGSLDLKIRIGGTAEVSHPA